MALSDLYAGQRLTAAVIAAGFPNGVVARGRRTTPTGNVTTTETGVLRLDGIPVKAGRGYEITTSDMNMDTSVSNDLATARIRINTAGTAITSSTQIVQMRNTIDDATNSNVIPLQCYYFPTSDATLSVLLTVQRVAGTGNIIIFCSGTEILDLVVRDMGIAPADSGVVI